MTERETTFFTIELSPEFVPLVGRRLARQTGRGKPLRVVSIVGPDAAGRTTLAAEAARIGDKLMAGRHETRPATDQAGPRADILVVGGHGDLHTPALASDTGPIPIDASSRCAFLGYCHSAGQDYVALTDLMARNDMAQVIAVRGEVSDSALFVLTVGAIEAWHTGSDFVPGFVAGFKQASGGGWTNLVKRGFLDMIETIHAPRVALIISDYIATFDEDALWQQPATRDFDFLTAAEVDAIMADVFRGRRANRVQRLIDGIEARIAANARLAAQTGHLPDSAIRSLHRAFVLAERGPR